MGYRRYVAVGDSQTEGLNDGDEATGYRGWADRLADALAAQEPGFTYANLAVRGRRAAGVRSEQTSPALALAPDLVTVMAGMNDLVRPGYDAAATAAELDAMLAAFTDSGATAVAFTFPDIGRIAPLVRHLRPRVLDLNDRLRAIADRRGAVLVDTFSHPVTTDPRLWSADRIHATPLGHARIAAATAHALGVPGSDDSWTDPLPPRPGLPPWRRAGAEAVWAAVFLGPWLLRRLRGRSSGDGRSAKRPRLLPPPAGGGP
ncbi:SGNH/GDSL hydrolase family protein [Streptomonospora wellingtoniae]|uniref:SGNH/GDSL hydrolase family protein n=1 Tax=Streptomonospora wellingtoniae TaxID=3075544 RepID=A0ABU2L0U5_9ACTN|nr:SGNH/GDSL hydrolase family protein [Streptomonospora sp. DSM 45055]MDT0305170.1 SGNH/GDSL hydrolase family protein [Streptomonospora sp. DSM 45055]